MIYTFFSLLLVAVVAVSDADRDGFPDQAEFRSAAAMESFRKWFVWIASGIADGRLHVSGVRDCASLVAVSYREAMKRHDRSWMRRVGLSKLPPIPDLRPFYYPKVPIIGRRIFRVRPGSFDGDVDSAFSTAATGEYLLRFNVVNIGRDIRTAQHGDIIGFYHPDSDMPYHLMIFIRTEKPMLLYHTGPGGEFRLIPVERLMQHVDPDWHPVPSNPYFLGIFRWKILE